MSKYQYYEFLAIDRPIDGLICCTDDHDGHKLSFGRVIEFQIDAMADPIFLFEPRNRNDKVPFDLTTFKYVPISQAAEIPNKVKAEIIAILRDTRAPI